jgi:hypothetical protein
VIGEWVPLAEPGISDTIRPDKGIKWIMGLRWEEIDENLILRHNTSKRGKDIEIDLRLAPMVLEELAWTSPDGRPPHPGVPAGLWADHPLRGHRLPVPGREFRRKWRIVANKAGLPKDRPQHGRPRRRHQRGRPLRGQAGADPARGHPQRYRDDPAVRSGGGIGHGERHADQGGRPEQTENRVTVNASKTR